MRARDRFHSDPSRLPQAYFPHISTAVSLNSPQLTEGNRWKADSNFARFWGRAGPGKLPATELPAAVTQLFSRMTGLTGDLVSATVRHSWMLCRALSAKGCRSVSGRHLGRMASYNSSRAFGTCRCPARRTGKSRAIGPLCSRLLTDLHQIITRLDVVLVWLGVAPCRV